MTSPPSSTSPAFWWSPLHSLTSFGALFPLPSDAILTVVRSNDPLSPARFILFQYECARTQVLPLSSSPFAFTNPLFVVVCCIYTLHASLPGSRFEVLVHLLLRTSFNFLPVLVGICCSISPPIIPLWPWLNRLFLASGSVLDCLVLSLPTSVYFFNRFFTCVSFYHNLSVGIPHDSFRFLLLWFLC